MAVITLTKAAYYNSTIATIHAHTEARLSAPTKIGMHTRFEACAILCLKALSILENKEEYMRFITHPKQPIQK